MRLVVLARIGRYKFSNVIHDLVVDLRQLPTRVKRRLCSFDYGKWLDSLNNVSRKSIQLRRSIDADHRRCQSNPDRIAITSRRELFVERPLVLSDFGDGLFDLGQILFMNIPVYQGNMRDLLAAERV